LPNGTLPNGAPNLPNGKPPSTIGDERVVVQVSSIPLGAEVLRDGALLGTTPCVVRVLPGSVTLQVRLAGYRPVTQTLAVREGARLFVKLEPLGKKPPPHAKPASRSATINPFEP
jgi:hypothetical protein